MEILKKYSCANSGRIIIFVEHPKNGLLPYTTAERARLSLWTVILIPLFFLCLRGSPPRPLIAFKEFCDLFRGRQLAFQLFREG